MQQVSFSCNDMPAYNESPYRKPPNQQTNKSLSTTALLADVAGRLTPPSSLQEPQTSRRLFEVWRKVFFRRAGVEGPSGLKQKVKHNHMRNVSHQEPHSRHHTRNRSLSLSSGGEISARTEEIQSALEVQVRRLFERFGGGALWNRSGQTSSSAGSAEDDNVNLSGTDADTQGSLRGTKNKKWSQKLSTPFRDLLGLVNTALLAIMNAAVAIFGVGVGVGLILGDSFRGSARADDRDDDFVGEEMEHERRRRGRGGEGTYGEGARDGRALHAGRHGGGASTGYIDQPSLSTLPAQ